MNSGLLRKNTNSLYEREEKHYAIDDESNYSKWYKTEDT